MDAHHNAPRLDLPEGYRIADWAVTALLGSGGWGTVYAAERVTGAASAPGAERVAVKLLRTDLLTPGQRASMEELIRQEVRFSSEAEHPNLVRTHTVVTLRDPDRPGLDGVTALVMDRAEHSLHDLITAGEQGTPVPGAGRILAGVATGLAHMHARGWVHADLKPANILLGPGDAVRLADFGLTVELDGTHAYIPPLGSLDHVPPEWWSERTGIRGTTVRRTADIWAFGVLAHQVLTGGLHPFPGGTARARALAAQAYAGGSAQLRLDDTLRPEWRELIGACLAPDHASRAVLGSEELARRVRDLQESARTRPRLRRTALLVGTGLGLAAATAATLTLLPDGKTGGRGATAPVSSPARTAAPATGITAGPPGAIPEDSDVPVALRATITNAAKRCTDPEITPAFLAAMLKAESGFDPKASRPTAGEYGIAMWTPSVFQAWAVDGDGDGDKDHMSPPDAIATMAVFTCWLDQRFKDNGLRDDLHALIAAGYRTSDKTVIEARGVPERTRPHVDRVLRHLEEYTR
ncbi:serine/threonine-protein kinase [Streptomyces sp. NPDC000229]|uniref:serine/threonine-protein kinase n=1 Tax=Streptomyces sp. NPDC000229 TaxID=3154247 RepID=UPI00331CFB41